MISRLGWVVLLAAFAVAGGYSIASADPATVHGAQRVLLRRGPGLDFEAFATVERGERVEVEEVTRGWALVRTGSGYHGYMSGYYLAYADGTAVVDAPPTPAQETHPVAAAATDELSRRNSDLTAEVERLKKQLEEKRNEPTAEPSPGEGLVALRAEVRRLADTTDALRSRLDSSGSGQSSVPLTGGEQWSTATVVVVSGLALLVGWFMGATLSRREERNKRTRIRF